MKKTAFIGLFFTSIYAAQIPNTKTINDRHWNLANDEFSCDVTTQSNAPFDSKPYTARVRFGRGQYKFIETRDPANIFLNLFNILSPTFLGGIIPINLPDNAELSVDKYDIIVMYKGMKKTKTIRYTTDVTGIISQISQSASDTSAQETMKLLWEKVSEKYRLRRIQVIRKEGDIFIDEMVDIEYVQAGSTFVPKRIKLVIKTSVLNFDEVITFSKCQP